MSKKPQQSKQTELTQQECKEIFNDIFLHKEDSWSDMQDGFLLNLIESEKRIPDNIKIELLFKKYRDTARDLNLYSK